MDRSISPPINLSPACIFSDKELLNRAVEKYVKKINLQKYLRTDIK